MARYGERQKTPDRRGVAPKRVVVTTRLVEELHEKANRAAEGLDISLTALLAELVERMEVDENGLPPWQSKYARAPKDDPQEALQLSA